MGRGKQADPFFFSSSYLFSGHDFYEIFHEHLVIHLQIDVDILFGRFGADPEVGDGGTLPEACGQYFDVPSNRFSHFRIHHQGEGDDIVEGSTVYPWNEFFIGIDIVSHDVIEDFDEGVPVHLLDGFDVFEGDDSFVGDV